MNLITVVLIFGSGIILTVGDLIMKKWVGSGSFLLYFLGMVVYMVAMFFLSQSYRYKNIAVASLMMVIFNIVTLLVVSWVFYQEKLSPIQLIGILLGLVSITLLELK